MSDTDRITDEQQPRPNVSTENDGSDGTERRPTTEQQPAPNISTEHQDTGDARRPSDHLDKGQDTNGPSIPRKTSLLGDE